VKIRSVQDAIALGLFQLEPKPGMYVIDGMKQRLVRVAADGSFVDPPRPAGPEANNLKGAKAPELSGKTWLNVKKPIKLSDLRGKPVLIVFFDLREPSFAPLIAPLLTYVDSYGKQGLSVIGVHRRCPRDEVSKRLAERRINFPVLIDDGQNAARYVLGFSASFLIDRKGNVLSEYKDLLVPPAEIEGQLDAGRAE
jgi:peroxiredoxin